MGVVCKCIADVIATIGRAIAGLFALIGDCIIAIVNAITSLCTF